jgi:predicted porin
MKFKAIALAISGAIAFSNAVAQDSSVSVFGVYDAGLLFANASGAGSAILVSPDGNTSSRLGFRGVEDLGAGLKANFWIEAAFNADTGTGGNSSTNNKDSVGGGALTFGRRATLGLAGGWGEVRLGRDYVPTFTNLTTAMHPFGTNGVGNAGQLFYQVNPGGTTGTTARTNVRASNSIGYFTPSGLGGFSANVMWATGEQKLVVAPGSAAADDGNYVGARVAYANGPLSVAVATGKTNYATGDFTQSNLGANYQFGPAKLMYLWGQNKVGSTKTNINMIGTQWAVGPGQLRFAYTKLTAKGIANDADQLSLGYVYDLSKRSAVYTTYSQVNNKGTGKTFSVGGGFAPTSAGGSSSGLEFGFRHTF